MTAEIAAPMMTRREAEEAVRAFHESGWRMRHVLLDMYERRAHEALGYARGDDAWERFCHEVLGVEWRADYLRRLRMWARVERDVLVPGGDSVSHVKQNRISAHAADELSRLPSAEERRAAWQELQSLRGTARELLRDLRAIVQRRLNTLSPPSVQAAPPPSAPADRQDPPRRSAPAAPIVSSFAPDPSPEPDVWEDAALLPPAAQQAEGIVPAPLWRRICACAAAAGMEPLPFLEDRVASWERVLLAEAGR